MNKQDMCSFVGTLPIITISMNFLLLFFLRPDSYWKMEAAKVHVGRIVMLVLSKTQAPRNMSAKLEK